MCLFIVELVDAASRGLHHHTSGAEVGGGREGEEGVWVEGRDKFGSLMELCWDRTSHAGGLFPLYVKRGTRLC